MHVRSRPRALGSVLLATTVLTLTAWNTSTSTSTTEAGPAQPSPLLQEVDGDEVTSLMAPVTGFGTVDGASVNVVDTGQTAELGEALRSSTLADYVSNFGTDYAPGAR